MLSRAEIEFFEENGYIPIRGAIPREVALLCREEVWRELEFIGVDKLDSRTWVRNVHGYSVLSGGTRVIYGRLHSLTHAWRAPSIVSSEREGGTWTL